VQALLALAFTRLHKPWLLPRRAPAHQKRRHRPLVTTVQLPKPIGIPSPRNIGLLTHLGDHHPYTLSRITAIDCDRAKWLSVVGGSRVPFAAQAVAWRGVPLRPTPTGAATSPADPERQTSDGAGRLCESTRSTVQGVRAGQRLARSGAAGGLAEGFERFRGESLLPCRADRWSRRAPRTCVRGVGLRGYRRPVGLARPGA
jgi:hypothetical protein